MKKYRILTIFFTFIHSVCLLSQPAIESITKSELQSHLYFLAADEMMGRDTPSEELKIASRYLAVQAESYGLKPIMANGSFFQEIPLRISRVKEEGTYIRASGKSPHRPYMFGPDFGFRNRSLLTGKIEGDLVFVGLGLHAPDQGWDDFKGIDLMNKMAIVLDERLPDDHPVREDMSGIALRRKSDSLRAHGAVSVIYVIPADRERAFSKNHLTFENRTGAGLLSDGQSNQEPGSGSIFYQVEARHSVAADLLGITEEEIMDMCRKIKIGEQVPSREIKDMKLEIQVTTENNIELTRNVLACVEGSDPDLKNEYIVYGAHYDHVGAREGDIYNGANDNGSGSVALLEMAEAMIAAGPKRSVIFAWFTGEEKGLWGSEYFLKRPPVPLAKIDAHINLDVISGDDAGSIAVVGHTRLSTGLDQLVNDVNAACCGMELDSYFEDPGPSSRFFFMSDHYPFVQHGIPSVWLFNGPEPNVHQPTDTPENINYEKMANVTRLAFAIGLEIANRENMLELDVVPEIRTRGSHNTEFDWSKVIGAGY